MVFKPYKRSDRVASGVYQVVAEVCHNELSDPRLAGIQLTDAEMTDDLQLVKIYYYIEGSDTGKKRCLRGLESAKGYLRKAISSRMGLRLVPDIRFYFDEGLKEAERLDKIINDLKQDEKAR